MQGTVKSRYRSRVNARATINWARKHGVYPMRGRWQRFYKNTFRFHLLKHWWTKCSPTHTQ